MMRPLRALVLTGILAAGFASAGCSGTFNTTVNINATISVMTTGDTDHVHPGSSIPCDINVMGAVLVDRDATPPAGHENDAVYVAIYVDDDDAHPVLVTAQAHVDVTVPEATPPGHHRMHCRLHRHSDDMPTNVEFSFEFNVEVGTGGGNDGGTTPVDAAG